MEDVLQNLNLLHVAAVEIKQARRQIVTLTTLNLNVLGVVAYLLVQEPYLDLKIVVHGMFALGKHRQHHHLPPKMNLQHQVQHQVVASMDIATKMETLTALAIAQSLAAGNMMLV